MWVPNLRTTPLLGHRTWGIQTDWRAVNFEIIGGYLDQEPGSIQQFHTGQLRPEAQPLTDTLLYTIFDRERFPSVEKWYLFHILSLEFCILLTAVNALYLKYEYKAQNQNVFSTFQL